MKTTYKGHKIELDRDRCSNTLRWHCFIEDHYVGYFDNQERGLALDKAKQIVNGAYQITGQPIATEI